MIVFFPFFRLWTMLAIFHNFSLCVIYKIFENFLVTSNRKTYFSNLDQLHSDGARICKSFYEITLLVKS